MTGRPLSRIGECTVCAEQMVSHVEAGEPHYWICRRCERKRKQVSGWFIIVVLLMLATIATVYSR